MWNDMFQQNSCSPGKDIKKFDCCEGVSGWCNTMFLFIFYPRCLKVTRMGHSSYATVHNTTTCSLWAFAGIPAPTMQELNNGSINTALTNQVTIHIIQQVSASCYSITPEPSSVCIMNLCYWSRYKGEYHLHCRITAEQQSVAELLSKEWANFLCQTLWRYFCGNFITKSLWKGRRTRAHKHQLPRKDWILFFIETRYM